MVRLDWDSTLAIEFNQLKASNRIESACDGGSRILPRYPGRSYDGVADGFVDVVEQGIDVSLRVGDLADSGPLARSVGSTRRLVVASRGYMRGQSVGTHALREPGDLLKHNCIVYTELATRNEWRFTAGQV